MTEPTTTTGGATVYAVAYLRVSTAEQAQHGLGLRTQADAIERWATDHGRTIIGWHKDEGRSGASPIGERLALVDAFDQAHLEGCELVVYRLDRLARGLIVQEQCIGELGRKGGRLRSCDATEDRVIVDPHADTEDAHTRTLMRQIFGAIGEWERSMIAMRLRAGRRKADLDGFYTGGFPPYGWMKPTHRGGRRGAMGGTRSRWEPDPGARWHVAAWIMLCRSQGHGYTTIARKLTELRIPTPGGKAAHWHDNQVKSVIRGVERMAARGYATPGPRHPSWDAPAWGFRAGAESPDRSGIGTPAAL
jgi:DNA invertase Pin-like site-specific DNA recombinase